MSRGPQAKSKTLPGRFLEQPRPLSWPSRSGYLKLYKSLSLALVERPVG